MKNEKKRRQLEATRNFFNALYELRCTGVRQIYYQDEMLDKITLVDVDTNEQIGEYAAGESLRKMFGQILDENALSSEYFVDLLEK